METNTIIFSLVFTAWVVLFIVDQWLKKEHDVKIIELKKQIFEAKQELAIIKALIKERDKDQPLDEDKHLKEMAKNYDIDHVERKYKITQQDIIDHANHVYTKGIVREEADK